jgi:hypothetical protein
MKWPVLANILFNISDATRVVRIPVFKAETKAEYLSQLQMIEMASRRRVEASVKLFAKNRKWPKIEDDEWYFLNQRAVVGMIVLDYLCAGATPSSSPLLPEPPASFSDGDQIELLLIHGWNSVGHRFWIQHQNLVWEEKKRSL